MDPTKKTSDSLAAPNELVSFPYHYTPGEDTATGAMDLDDAVDLWSFGPDSCAMDLDDAVDPVWPFGPDSCVMEDPKDLGFAELPGDVVRENDEYVLENPDGPADDGPVHAMDMDPPTLAVPAPVVPSDENEVPEDVPAATPAAPVPSDEDEVPEDVPAAAPAAPVPSDEDDIGHIEFELLPDLPTAAPGHGRSGHRILLRYHNAASDPADDTVEWNRVETDGVVRHCIVFARGEAGVAELYARFPETDWMKPNMKAVVRNLNKLGFTSSVPRAGKKTTLKKQLCLQKPQFAMWHKLFTPTGLAAVTAANFPYKD